MMACFSHGASQKSRGTQPLCSLTPIAFSPVVELAGSHAQLVDGSSGADLGFFRPVPDEIHHQVPHIVRHPHFGQSSRKLFLKAMCSAINSANTSSLVWIFFSRNSIRCCSA